MNPRELDPRCSYRSHTALRCSVVDGQETCSELLRVLRRCPEDSDWVEVKRVEKGENTESELRKAFHSAMFPDESRGVRESFDNLAKLLGLPPLPLPPSSPPAPAPKLPEANTAREKKEQSFFDRARNYWDSLEPKPRRTEEQLHQEWQEGLNEVLGDGQRKQEGRAFDKKDYTDT
eukprot:tig00020960_g16591.t1